MDTEVNLLFVFCLVAEKVEGKGKTSAFRYGLSGGIALGSAQLIFSLRFGLFSCSLSYSDGASNLDFYK